MNIEDHSRIVRTVRRQTWEAAFACIQKAKCLGRGEKIHNHALEMAKHFMQEIRDNEEKDSQEDQEE